MDTETIGGKGTKETRVNDPEVNSLTTWKIYLLN